MNRKISLGAAITLAIMFSTVTFIITMIYSRNAFDSMVFNIKERETLYAKLSEVDRLVRQRYYNRIDEDTLGQELIKGYMTGIEDKYGAYMTAEQYSELQSGYQGKTVDMVGGGACQASSTLYAATLYANLEIVQRINHGFASDYIGLGMDATVAEGGPEFEFRNNTLYPIKVEAQFFKKGANDYVRVALHGTKTDDYSVEIDTEILSTTPYGEEYVETDELAPGETKVEQTPYNGYDVKTYRCIYDGDGNLISRTLEARSRYRMRNRIILVGKTPEVAVPEEPVAPPQVVVPEEPVAHSINKTDDFCNVFDFFKKHCTNHRFCAII